MVIPRILTQKPHGHTSVMGYQFLLQCVVFTEQPFSLVSFTPVFTTSDTSPLSPRWRGMWPNKVPSNQFLEPMLRVGIVDRISKIDTSKQITNWNSNVKHACIQKYTVKYLYIQWIKYIIYNAGVSKQNKTSFPVKKDTPFPASLSSSFGSEIPLPVRRLGGIPQRERIFRRGGWCCWMKECTSSAMRKRDGYIKWT